jgi:hypothetical protein
MPPPLDPIRRDPAGRAHLAFLLPFLLLAAGCTDPGATGAPAVAVSDSAGVRIVTTPGDRVDRPLALSLEHPAHLRLGVVEGAEELQFHTPNGAARLSDGRLVISESGARLRLFDEEGRFLRWIGALGEGPGEFQLVSSFGVLDGDTIAVYDGRRRRVLVFGPEGGLVREAGVQLPAPFTQPRGTRFLSDGRLLVEASNPGTDAPDGVRRRERIGAVLFDPGGGNPGVVAQADGMEVIFEQAGPGIRLMANVTPTFHPLPRFTAGPGGVYAWDGARFEVRHLDGDGGLRAVYRVERPAPPVTAEVIRAYEDGPGVSVSPQLREVRERVLGSRAYAETLPHFQTVLAEPGGALWLSAFTGHVGGLPTRWWRLSPEGELEGYLDLPEGFRVLAFEEGEVIGVERDALEVPFVVGYRIR